MYLIGIDVGTHSVRAGLFSNCGKLIKTASIPITTCNPYPDMFEQSAKEIWDACCTTVHSVTSGIKKEDVCAIGFDATCSLVMIGNDMKPLSVNVTGNAESTVLLWMDHRAVREAEIINTKAYLYLEVVGGKISPEMQPPKLMWLKKNLPEQWYKVKYFFDLPDYLTWMATGNPVRSMCSLVCKWLYMKNDNITGWIDDFWKQIGLEEILLNDYEKIGSEVVQPGTSCGSLTSVAAKNLGLHTKTVVATSIIDAYAGALGVLACQPSIWPALNTIEDRIALCCGTSTCLIKVSNNSILTPGVWGPYYSVMLPGMWCAEAGQSAAGYLIDHIVKSHPIYSLLKATLKNQNHVSDILNEKLYQMQIEQALPSVSYLTSDFHIYPDFHGNRSPLADPSLKGMMCGLTISNDVESLAIQYLASIQALAYSSKHILNCLCESGHIIKTLLICGGLQNNRLYVQMHADITGLPVILPEKQESVLLGSAMLGAVAIGHFTLSEAMFAMSGGATVIMPSVSDSSYHLKKYKIFLEMLLLQKKIQDIMKKDK